MSHPLLLKQDVITLTYSLYSYSLRIPDLKLASYFLIFFRKTFEKKKPGTNDLVSLYLLIRLQFLQSFKMMLIELSVSETFMSISAIGRSSPNHLRLFTETPVYVV